MSLRSLPQARGYALWLCVGSIVAACQRPVSTTAPAEYVRRNPSAPTVALVNGRWLTGRGFEPRTLYAVEGILTTERPPRVDSTIDLTGLWVIPPFGDAHSHNLSFPAPRQDSVRDAYLAEGSFYVQVLGNRRSATEKVRDRFNHPCAIDVTWANGILTSTLGHGFEVAETLALGYRDVWTAIYDERAATIKRSRIAENDHYWFIDSLADLDAKWPAILAGKPDLIKVSLLFTPDPALPPPPPWPASRWFMHGLDSTLVAPIVERAHAAGLRVAAHIETARDFDVAVRAGVDIIAHLLGPDVPPGFENQFLISENAARLAGERGVVVIATAAISKDVTAGHAERLTQIQEKQRQNLRLLARHGVPIAVGRDEVWHTAREEFDALRELGLWDNRALLTMWGETTPRTIFPGRRIGRLEPGYEASFLALRRNPLQDLDALHDIALRVKQGCVLG